MTRSELALAFGASLLATVIACGPDSALPGTCRTKRRAPTGRPPRCPRQTRTTFTIWTAASRSARRSDGPQHVARLDRRQRSVLGHDSASKRFGTLDFLKTVSSHPVPCKYSRDNRFSIWDWSTSRASRKPQAPIPTAMACGSTSAIPRARPTRSTNDDEVPGHPDRVARQDDARRLVLRGAERDCRAAPVPEP